MLVELVALAVGATALFYWWSTRTFHYWQNKGVKIPFDPTPYLGHLKSPFMLKSSLSTHFQKMYKSTQSERFIGYYKLRQPALMLRDPELVKHVLVKDFNSFHDNDLFINEKTDPLLAYHILATHGPRWKFIRTKLTPAFTSGKIKNMFPLVIDICKDMKSYVDRALAKGDKSIETKVMSAHFKTDVAALCAFGVRSHALSDEDSAFKQKGLGLINNGKLRSIALMIIYFSPKVKQFLGLKFVSDSLADFFRSLVKETMEYRDKNKIVRNDFIQILMQLKSKGFIEYEPGEKEEKRENDTPVNYDHDKGKTEWTHDMLTAQTLGFIGDSFETLSTALSFAIFEISYNPEIQRKLKEEIETVLNKHNNKICYDALMEMSYLDQIFNESVRKYPPIGVMNRICTKNYTIPGTDVKIEEGTAVAIPVYALHHDPQYWPDPERFDPERFNEKNTKKIVPYTYLPFGEGPRMCLGNRFGRLQVKAAIATVIKFYELEPAGITRYPVKFAPHFGTHPKDGLHVKFIPRT
ncbi:cytochrome P450 6k1-like [Neocloeon triangulifer]|uniref:cytochrome P450 6k1-like n=1 Tax=Neocloeon triangulifer TaxID=2078957 RepID=UPI00286F602F|nr:cytochrome P450 6k1-like [Neocloeon triangulifer]